MIPTLVAIVPAASPVSPAPISISIPLPLSALPLVVPALPMPRVTIGVAFPRPSPPVPIPASWLAAAASLPLVAAHFLSLFHFPVAVASPGRAPGLGSLHPSVARRIIASTLHTGAIPNVGACKRGGSSTQLTRLMGI
jgi:hypothetical protein